MCYASDRELVYLFDVRQSFEWEVMVKKISAAAINALKEALGQIYWYKSDLRSFLLATLSDNNLLSRINWNEYKINIAGSLVNYMQLHEEAYQKESSIVVFRNC